MRAAHEQAFDSACSSLDWTVSCEHDDVAPLPLSSCLTDGQAAVATSSTCACVTRQQEFTTVNSTTLIPQAGSSNSKEMKANETTAMGMS
jgi:hypothetical protein